MLWQKLLNNLVLVCPQNLETLLVDNMYNSSQVFEDTLVFKKPI